MLQHSSDTAGRTHMKVTSKWVTSLSRELRARTFLEESTEKNPPGARRMARLRMCLLCEQESQVRILSILLENAKCGICSCNTS